MLMLLSLLLAEALRWSKARVVQLEARYEDLWESYRKKESEKQAVIRNLESQALIPVELLDLADSVVSAAKQGYVNATKEKASDFIGRVSLTSIHGEDENTPLTLDEEYRFLKLCGEIHPHEHLCLFLPISARRALF
ncbi:MAG: hypothetical protein M1830_004884 [Pleopsidium flavum]|nr:MAG: hypothetical protein M1830_004884 [Pleopsidium flavum]